MAQPSSTNPYLPNKDGSQTFFEGPSKGKGGKDGRLGLLGLFGRLRLGVKISIFAASICIIGFFLSNYTNGSSSVVLSNQDETESPDASGLDGSGEGISVHIDGAVVQPGVYDIKGGKDSEPRVRDAVDAAQGLTEEADISSINLAAKIEDGQKIHIPKVEEVVADTSSLNSSEMTNGNTGQDAKSGRVNINTASEKDLETLPGIGEATAKAIVEDRKQNGSFKTIEDLMRVSGIGEKKFEKIKRKICV